MAYSLGHSWITEHRRWEDFLSAAIGVLVVLSPSLAAGNFATAVTISTGFVGVMIVMLAMLELMSLQRWEEVLELLCGAWVIASPVVLNYGGPLRVWHFVLGGIVVALALLELAQDRNLNLKG
jgi:hypothetical protein